jgi:hypothetical protein
MRSHSLHIICRISTLTIKAVAVYGLDPVELISGSLPLRQQRLVEAWAEMHREELMEDWRLLQQGRRPQPIAPLQ